MARNTVSTLSIARNALLADTRVRRGHRPLVAAAWIFGTNAERDTLLRVEGPGFIRRGLREAAIRYEDGSPENKAFFALRADVALDREFRLHANEDVMFFAVTGTDGEVVFKSRRKDVDLEATAGNEDVVAA